jgi:hypothetical protein
LIFESDLSWAKEGKCQTSDGQPKAAWTILPREKVRLGKELVEGKVLIAMAVEVCRGCPVQWDCARHALDSAPNGDYIWGTWGARMEDLRWAKRLGAVGVELIEAARLAREPVQVVLRDARAAKRKRAAVA